MNTHVIPWLKSGIGIESEGPLPSPRRGNGRIFSPPTSASPADAAVGGSGPQATRQSTRGGGRANVERTRRASKPRDKGFRRKTHGPSAATARVPSLPPASSDHANVDPTHSLACDALAQGGHSDPRRSGPACAAAGSRPPHCHARANAACLIVPIDSSPGRFLLRFSTFLVHR